MKSGGWKRSCDKCVGGEIERVYLRVRGEKETWRENLNDELVNFGWGEENWGDWLILIGSWKMIKGDLRWVWVKTLRVGVWVKLNRRR